MRSSTALARVLAAQTRMTTFSRGASHRRPGLLTHSRRRISKAPKGPTGTPPSAPTLVSVTAGNAQATIAWTDNAAGTFPITAHNIYRGTSSGGEVYVGQTTAASPYVDTGLTNGTTYYYKLTAVSAAGESGLSGELSGTPVAYSKPSLLALGTGQTSTITSVAAGYTVSGTFGSGTENYYLNSAKSSGKWYCEAVATAAGGIIAGVADDIGTTVSNGGYNTTTNAAVAFSAVAWVDAGWAGTSITGTWPGSTTGDVVSIAWDLDSATRTLKAYLNNVLQVTISWTSAVTVYPMICPYGPMTLQLGPSGCTYSPPSGYTHI